MQTTTPPVLFWNQVAVPFDLGETIAAALSRGGVLEFGVAAGGMQGRYFCGIGNCQACLVCVDGASPVEACLTPAQPGMYLTPALQVGSPPWSGP